MRHLIRSLFFLCVFFSLRAELTESDCSKELLLAYFPKPFVTETLKKYNVPQEEWEAINRELAAKEGDVIRIVEEKASKLTPNPLQEPQNRQEAVGIFRETLLQVFAGVLYAHGVSDETKVQGMLDDIQKQKAARFVECMKKKKIQPHSPPQRNNSDAEF